MVHCALMLSSFTSTKSKSFFAISTVSSNSTCELILIFRTRYLRLCDLDRHPMLQLKVSIAHEWKIRQPTNRTPWTYYETQYCVPSICWRFIRKVLCRCYGRGAPRMQCYVSQNKVYHGVPWCVPSTSFLHAVAIGADSMVQNDRRRRKYQNNVIIFLLQNFFPFLFIVIICVSSFVKKLLYLLLLVFITTL